MSTAAENIEISLSTPGDWIELDPARYADAEALDRIVDDKLDEIPQLAPHREKLLGTVTSTMGRAREDGVLFCAVQADLTDTEQPLIGTLSVVVTGAPPPDPDVEEVPELADVEAALEEDDEGREVNQRVVTSMLLPGGPALRVARLVEVPLVEAEEAPAGGGGDRVSLRVLSVQYFFALPGDDVHGYVVLNFTSPTIGAHLRLQALWHELATDFRFSGQPVYEIDLDVVEPDLPEDAGENGAGDGAPPR